MKETRKKLEEKTELLHVPSSQIHMTLLWVIYNLHFNYFRVMNYIFPFLIFKFDEKLMKLSTETKIPKQ